LACDFGQIVQRPLVDEDFWNAALRGTDKLDPIQLAASSFRETRTGALKGTSQDLLIHLRGRMYEAIERQSATLEQDRMMGRRGPLRARLSRAVLQAVGLTPDNGCRRKGCWKSAAVPPAW
jgi:hypothetical protein